jgi:hypothetical protein
VQFDCDLQRFLLRPLIFSRFVANTTDAVHAALRSWGDAVEVSFQSLVNDLHVHAGLLAGTVAEIVGFVIRLGITTRGRCNTKKRLKRLVDGGNG